MRFFQSLAEIARVTANIRGNWPRIRVLGEWYRESYLPHQACTQKKSIEGKRKRFSSAIEITFQDVSYGWTDGNLVLKNANFVIPQGSITAITGPSGRVNYLPVTANTVAFAHFRGNKDNLI